MSDSTTLAETFLGLGCKTFVAVGTGFTVVGTVYGLHKMTGAAITVFNNLPLLLGPSKLPAVGSKDTPLITRQDLVDGFTSFGKIGLLIALGIGIKATGAWMGLDSTVEGFNSFLYKQTVKAAQ